jgi:four helix bundle protein
MKSFRELRVWQKAMDLVETVYLLTQDFPKQETYGLVSQVRRAVISVPSNIAEGHTREHIKEYNIYALINLRSCCRRLTL